MLPAVVQFSIEARPGVRVLPTSVTSIADQMPSGRRREQGERRGMQTREISSRVDNLTTTAVMRATLPVAEIGPWLGAAYGAIAKAVTESGAAIIGMPFARYHRRGEAAAEFDVEAGFPVDRAIDSVGDILPSVLPAGNVATTIHVGPYDEMAPTYEALYRWVRERSAEPAGDPWEVYRTDPGAEPDPAKWQTEVVLPYRN